MDEHIRVRSTTSVVRSPKSLQHKLFGEGWDRTDPATTQAEPLQAVPLGLIRPSQPSIHGDFWQMALTKEAERLGIHREPSRYTPTMAVAPGRRVMAALSSTGRTQGRRTEPRRDVSRINRA